MGRVLAGARERRCTRAYGGERRGGGRRCTGARGARQAADSLVTAARGRAPRLPPGGAASAQPALPVPVRGELGRSAEQSCALHQVTDFLSFAVAWLRRLAALGVQVCESLQRGCRLRGARDRDANPGVGREKAAFLRSCQGG